MLVHNVQGKYVANTAVPLSVRDITRYIVVHHAAAVYPPGRAVQMIYAYHSAKWPKYGRIGYQIVLQAEVNGTIAQYNVNPHNCIGANVAMRNHEVLGICCATLFVGIPPANWFSALVEAVQYAQRIYPNAQVVGHTDIALPGYKTACPGTRWVYWKAALYAAIGQ